VLVQAGGSPSGRASPPRSGSDFHRADDIAQAIEFRSLFTVDGGARPTAESVKIQPGLSPIIGSTMTEARRKEIELDELVHRVSALDDQRIPAISAV